MRPASTKTLAVVISVIGFVGGADRSACADDATAVRKELQAIADRMDEAYRKKDAHLQASFYAPAERDAVEKQYRRVFGEPETFELSSTRVGKVTLRGDEAIAPMTQRVVVARKWRGTTFRREYRSLWEEPWVKTQEGWRYGSTMAGSGKYRSLGGAEEQFWRSLKGPVVAEADRDRIRGELQAIYDRHAQAALNNDAAALVADLAPEFELLAPSGMVSERPVYEANIRQALKTNRNERNSSRIEDVTAAGNEAITRVKRTRVFTGPGPDGKTRRTSDEVMALDLWRHDADGWKLVASDQYQAAFRTESAEKDAGGERT